MCGIAGILRVYDPGEPVPPPLVSIPEAWLDILDDSIKHRGPDGRGRFRDRVIRREDGATVDVALVHRRLSILDHAGGHQPMVSVRKGAGVIAAKRASGPSWVLYEEAGDPVIHAWSQRLSESTSQRAGSASDRPGLPTSMATSPDSDDLIAVVFNGCIYNHRELRRELQAAGHVFTSDHSDTEVLVHGWREWGKKVGCHLDGMFAWVLWDGVRGALAMAQDRFGEKPLYYSSYQQRGGWVNVIGSSPTGALRLEVVAPTCFSRSRPTDELEWWIRLGYCSGVPLSPCSSLGPGVVGVLTGDGWEVEHCAGDVGRLTVATPAAASPVERIDSLLVEAVERRLAADVPLGCFLSGGIDSAIIATIAKRAMGHLETFTVRMPDIRFDESSAAARTARTIESRHTTLECDARPVDDLLHLIHQIGLPFGDSSLLPMHWLSAAVRRQCTVALSGDGGDELFYGYERYRAVEYLPRVPGWWKSLASVIPEGHPKARGTKLARLLRAGTGAGYFDLVAIFPSADPIFDHPKNSVPSPYPHINVQGARAVDVQDYLPHDLMRKADTASMAVALEVRAPMLDSTLAAACLAMPPEVLMPRGQRKGLLKQVARKYLPADIVDRPKQGFAIPIGEWFRSDYGGLRQMLLDHLRGPEPFGPDSLGINSMINMAFVKQMIKEHDDAGSASIWPWKGRDHSQRLYMLLVLSIWAKWLGGLGRSS